MKIKCGSFLYFQTDVDTEGEKENEGIPPKKKKKDASEDEERKERKAKFDSLVHAFNKVDHCPNAKFGEYVAASLDSLKHDYNRELLKQKIKLAVSTITYQESMAEVGAMESQQHVYGATATTNTQQRTQPTQQCEQSSIIRDAFDMAREEEEEAFALRML